MAGTEVADDGSKETLDRLNKELEKELEIGPGLGSISPQHSKRQKENTVTRELW